MTRGPFPIRTAALSGLGLVAIALAGVAGIAASADNLEPVLGEPFDQRSAHTAPEIEPHGNLRKSLGEAGELVDPAGTPLFSIAITGTARVDSCPSRRLDLDPAAGEFLVLDIEVSLEHHAPLASAENPQDVYFPLLPETFVVFDERGAEVSETASQSAWECFSDDDLLPSFVFPGENVRGRVVLETGVPTGTVAYMPAGAPGWEWQF